MKGADIAGERSPDTDFNLDDGKHTDLYANGDQFSLTLLDAAGDVDCSTYAALTDDNAAGLCYSSQYQQGTAGTETWTTFRPAVSSFPHNDLGKDFRFNLRMMHHLGEGDSTEFFDSYYFYRVNTITIVFPSVVSCPYEIAHDASAQILHKCMDSAGFNGHQETEPFNPAATNVARFTEALTDTLTTAPTLFPALCSATGVVGKHSCGETYTVNGYVPFFVHFLEF